MKKYKKILIIALVGITAYVSIKADDDAYFQITKNLDIFGSVYKELNIYYVDDVKPGELMKTGIDAMLNSLDPYTNFIPESRIEEYKFMTTGQYGGVGALIRKQGDYIVLTEVYEGYPAEKGGLMAGDKLLEIDGNSVVGKNSDAISTFLKGEPKSTVEIIVERGIGENVERITKSIEREEIKIKDVPYFGMLDEHTGYITLSSFTQTASKEFIAAYRKLKENPNFDRLIFDIRGNGGGLLREAVNIVNVFVDRGTKIVDTRGKRKEWNKEYRALNAPLDLDIPVVVLINGSSASASEIVAGALQDLDRAVIIGKNSFGKGLVQVSRPVSYNSNLKVTVAKYYIPSGRCIQRIDYSQRDKDGKAKSVPDSLIATFSSLKNKRTLYDGKGIKPDVKIAAKTVSPLSEVLLLKSHIFNFATAYRFDHAEIASAEEFRLSDEEYQSFIQYLSDKDYSYDTDTETLLKKLKEIAQEEKYFEQAKEEYALLEAKMQPDKKDDLQKFADEIKELIEYEIISRYYYQKGQIAASLSRDPVIEEAKAILSDKDRYQKILGYSK